MKGRRRGGGSRGEEGVGKCTGRGMTRRGRMIEGREGEKGKG